MKTMAAGSFKSKCFAVMDEAHAKCETVIITKHGEYCAGSVPRRAWCPKIFANWFLFGGSWKRADQDPSPALRQGRNNLPQCVQILRVNHLGRRMRVAQRPPQRHIDRPIPQKHRAVVSSS